MANAVTLIFPHQLFENHPALSKDREVYLAEEWLFFRQYNFHRQKLVLHRSSMKFYESWLQEKGFKVHYVETCKKENDCKALVAGLAAQSITDIHIADPADDWLLKRMQQACDRNNINLHMYDSPGFLNSTESLHDYFSKRKTYFQTDFYTWQRKQRNILMEQDGKPAGGKWTFDADNRQKFPKNEKLPAFTLPEPDEFITEAKAYVRKHFPGNYGDIDGPCLFAVSFTGAQNWLDDFLQNRFEKFGVYEDAIVARESVLHHSVLTPMLNIGLLDPKQIIDKALDAAKKYHLPLNSLEGFTRQVLGWREFINSVYEFT
ncbi:MAG: cryptochrome/photolyase family protein, partial [Ferruginibacter sp.]